MRFLVLLFVIYATCSAKPRQRTTFRPRSTTEPEVPRTTEVEVDTTVAVDTTTARLIQSSTTLRPEMSTTEYPRHDVIHYKEEVHLKNVRQLTFGGINRRASFSSDGNRIVFQATNWGTSCDQIFEFNLENGYMTKLDMPPMLSTGKGIATSASAVHDSDLVAFASTHGSHPSTGSRCPKKVCSDPKDKTLAALCRSRIPLVSINQDYDIYLTNRSEPGSILRRLTNNTYYDSEAVVAPVGDTVVFSTYRKGDVNLWQMKSDGSHVKQLTLASGYDGQAAFSPDGSKLVWASSRPQTPAEEEMYYHLLKDLNVVSANKLEIRMSPMNGTEVFTVTNLGRSNSNPTYHPDGEHIIFASNFESRGQNQNLYSIHESGNQSTLVQLTFDPVSDSFPAFSPSGTPHRLVFSSARNASRYGELNLFIADYDESGKPGNSAGRVGSLLPVILLTALAKLLLW